MIFGVCKVKYCVQCVLCVSSRPCVTLAAGGLGAAGEGPAVQDAALRAFRPHCHRGARQGCGGQPGGGRHLQRQRL